MVSNGLNEGFPVHLDVSEFLIYIVAGLVGWWFRHLRSFNKWRKAKKLALQKLRDPQDTDDPGEAMTEAVNTIQSPRIRKETQSLVKMINGTGPHRKIDK